MSETPRARLIAYIVAVLAPAVSLLVRWPLWPVLENSFPHMTFFLAVMIAAYFGGLWPGLLATGLGAFACGNDSVILEKICQAFRDRLPDHLTTVQDAFRERDHVRLREVSHKFCWMVAAFSTVAGGVASDIEDLAAQGQLDDARPLVEQLESMTQELLRTVDSLSLENLRQQIVPARV